MGPMNTVLKRPSLSDEAVSRLVDPRTGTALRPLGVVGGRLVWPMMGASPDDESSDEKKESEGEDDGPEGSGSSEDGEGSDKGDPKAKIAALEDEKNRHVRRRQEVEKELAEAKKALEEIQGKDKSESEKAIARADKAEAELKLLQENLREANLKNAFLADNTYNWHNPGRALSLADLSEVEIDSDGTVHGLKAALDALAKSDAYLLKKAGKDDEEEPPNTGGDAKNRSKKDRDKAAADDAAFRAKYPALQR